MPTDFELKNRFTYHPPKDNQAELYQGMRGRALELARHINSITAESREKSLALTHLDEVVFWTNASIAREL